jgi:predicted secreted protein
MSWFGALVVFTVVWWLVFFVTLPFGVRRIENPEQGHDAGAPEKPRLLIKAGITTAIAGAVTGGLAAAVAYELIDFRELLF